MNKPTIGRIVLYKDSQGDVLPAIIVFVGMPEDENSWINIRVFENTTGSLPYVTSVPKNRETSGQSNYSWEWPMQNIAVTVASIAPVAESSTASAE